MIELERIRFARRARSAQLQRHCPVRPARSASVCTGVLLALTLALTLALGACGPRPSNEPDGRGVLVIVIDALRADHLSSNGYDRDTTPVLDSLAVQGVAFQQAFSSSPEILPAHAALLTGCDPTLAQRAPFDAGEGASLLSSWYIPEEVPRLAQEFISHGFITAAFVDHPAIAPVYGFGAGFQELFSFRTEAVLARQDHAFEIVAARFRNWLTSQDPSQDWFAYVHTNDLERLWRRPDSDPQWDTYFAPRPELAQVPPVSEAERIFFAVPRSRWLGGTSSLGEYEARYDGALRQLDSKLGRLFEALRRIDRLKNTTVVVVGSYGVSFGESGLILDSGTLSDADLHVPLIIRPAPQMSCARGTKVRHVASTIDLAPTLLELEQIPVPRAMHGLSQLAALRGDAAAVRERAYASGGLQAGFTVFDERWCYERSSPGRSEAAGRVSPLSISWYGDELDHRFQYREFLHDRRDAHGAGHLEHSALDADVPPPFDAAATPDVAAAWPAATARTLRQAGEEWYTWIERERDVLQRGPDATQTLDAKMLDELRRRGWIGAPRPR